MEKHLCKECRKELKEDHFEFFKKKYGLYRRKVCRKCYYEQRNKVRSSTPYNYLKIVIQQLKSKRVKEGVEWDLSWEELCEVWDDQEAVCALSGVLMTHKKGDGHQELNATIDRVDGSGPYTKDNVQLVCHRANLIKHTMTEDDLYWWCRNIVTNKDKI